MVNFQSLFLESHSDVVEFEGNVYHRYFSVTVEKTVILRCKFISSDSSFNQAIVFSFPYGFGGKVKCGGKEIPVRKTSFPKLNFWMDTTPTEFEVVITNFSGEMKICNGSDPLGTKQFCKYLSEGCAMIVHQMGDNNYRFCCNDHEYDNDCDDFVFEVEVLGQVTEL